MIFPPPKFQPGMGNPLAMFSELALLFSSTGVLMDDRLELKGNMMLNLDNLNQEEVDKIQRYLDKNPTIKKRFISEDNQYFLITIQPYESGALNTFRDSITTISSPILNDYEIHYGGQAYLTGTMPELIRDDVVGLARIGVLIMTVILLANLRSIAGVTMVLMLIGLSLIAMIGVQGWVYHLTGSDRFLL